MQIGLHIACAPITNLSTDYRLSAPTCEFTHLLMTGLIRKFFAPNAATQIFTPIGLPPRKTFI
jgi:hypothetical protein